MTALQPVHMLTVLIDEKSSSMANCGVCTLPSGAARMGRTKVASLHVVGNAPSTKEEVAWNAARPCFAKRG